ncbi:MAG TPA: SusD/RagB family nutrient-binding outer membrane lipoprotein [Gemmatimonadaceae bacterium]|nr:SusD/RagB family nutrient-binding outer membrane lipoprotein [Gemmatimonadaceae bacterium]
MTMTRFRLATAAGATLLAVAGCVDFEGPRLSENPNSPSNSNITASFTGMQAFQFANLNGDYTRLASVFTQQMAGTGRQWITLDAPFVNDEGQFGSWNGFYTNGGLIDVRTVQDLAREAGDRKYLGIAQVWEALVMSYVADFWGNAPYREALKNRTPVLDPQAQIYADLQLLLDSAITNIAAGGTGPGSVDKVYGGNSAQWTKAAQSLKARLFLRTANVDNTAYAKALAAAQLGILSPADDFTTYQSSTAGEENIWFQFRRGRGTDVGAGKFLVDLMRTRNDPRLASYFSTAGGGGFRGALPGEEDETVSWLSAVRGAPEFRQPILTADETQLIIAETQARTGNASALASMNVVRSRYGLAPRLALTGAPLLTAILEEKYVANFQNPEVWADYKRTCYPNIALANGATSIPMRFIYGADERATNPNVPNANAAPKRNPVNPLVTVSVDGTACRGQR